MGWLVDLRMHGKCLCVVLKLLNGLENSRVKEQPVVLKGIVREAKPGATFLVEVQNGHKVLATLSGKMKMHLIHVLPGDKVILECSPYDLTRGRITVREL